MKSLINFIFKTDRNEKFLFLRCLLYMYFYFFYLKFVPLKTWSKQITFKSSDSKKEFDLYRLKKSIQRASKFYFFKNVCLVSCLTAKKTLNKHEIKSSLYLGLNIKNEFIAHAWLRVGEFEIIKKNGNYSEILKIE